MSTITINRVLVEPADYRTNEERKDDERRAAAATFKALFPTPEELKDVIPKDQTVAAVVHLPAEKVTGACKLHVDPATSGAPEVPVDRPDLLGHMVKEGRCVNPGCTWRVLSVSLLGLSDDERAAKLAQIRAERRQRIESDFPADLEKVKKDVRASNHLAGIDERCVGEKRPSFVPRVVNFCSSCTLAIGAGCVCGAAVP